MRWRFRTSSSIEGLEPHNVDIVYLFFTDKATVWVDTSDTIDIKIAALREHTSQLRKPEELEEHAARLGGRERERRSAPPRPRVSAC